MEVVDKYTFRLTTKQPFAEALSELGGRQKAIVPREAVEKFEERLRPYWQAFELDVSLQVRRLTAG